MLICTVHRSLLLLDSVEGGDPLHLPRWHTGCEGVVCPQWIPCPLGLVGGCAGCSPHFTCSVLLGTLAGIIRRSCRVCCDSPTAETGQFPGVRSFSASAQPSVRSSPIQAPSTRWTRSWPSSLRVSPWRRDGHCLG